MKYKDVSFHQLLDLDAFGFLPDDEVNIEDLEQENCHWEVALYTLAINDRESEATELASLSSIMALDVLSEELKSFIGYLVSQKYRHPEREGAISLDDNKKFVVATRGTEFHFQKAVGIHLDRIGYDFNIDRRDGLDDNDFRKIVIEKFKFFLEDNPDPKKVDIHYL
jgi:hypothetical protein